ncbi:hypothetical protein PTSG_10348 [Salpingoeca rosetta]|uniref:Uncharacterized protein n=1 Tax=Salpingoeca rosetta (strain ATCC 50818 / BSB-021) TaxID=946362 RepID=F2UR19_SALR5|nr:uncharacterized protein PTSG_10348 [Salpingoeca rosetta]EGD80074.1 hypothetical protein PTSG_10348 [Salpingoeca rosetta]|eukprot:XP_004988399.1 hypothetical protein PTSG_10348 [Salpingoeca rosetta]
MVTSRSRCSSVCASHNHSLDVHGSCPLRAIDNKHQATAPKVKCILEAATSVGSIPGSSSTISATTATTPTNANSTVYRDRPVDINHARWLAKDASTTAATPALLSETQQVSTHQHKQCQQGCRPAVIAAEKITGRLGETMTPGEPAEHRHEFHHHHNGREVEDDAVVAPSSPHCRGLMPSTRDLHEQDTDKKPSPAHATAQLTHASQQQQHQWLQQQQQHEPVQQQQEDEMQKGGGRGGRLRGSNTPSLVFPPNCTRKEAVPSKARKQPRVSRPAKSNKPTAIRREDPAIRQLILKCRERERQKQQQQEPQRAQQQRAGKHRATREATVNRQQHPAKRKQQVMRSGGSYSTTKDARGKQEQRYQQGAALTRTLTGFGVSWQPAAKIMGTQHEETRSKHR